MVNLTRGVCAGTRITVRPPNTTEIICGIPNLRIESLIPQSVKFVETGKPSSDSENIQNISRLVIVLNLRSLCHQYSLDDYWAGRLLTCHAQ